MAKIKDTILPATEGYIILGEQPEINSISLQDAEVISIFIELIEKLEGHKNLIELINIYKLISDADFLTMLNSYNESFEGSMSRKIPLLNIKDQFIFDIRNIFSFTKAEHYETKTNRLVPILIINKTDNTKAPYANTQIYFSSENDFEESYKQIKEKLSEYTNIIFI